MRCTRIWLIAASLLTLLLPSRSAQAVLQVYELGNLTGGRNAVPQAINDDGIVGGGGWPASGEYAAVLFGSPQGTPNLNLNAGGGWSQIRGINNAGVIVGFEANDPIRPGQAYVFDPTGAGNNTSLGAGKSAYAINDSNRVVGSSHSDGATGAWFWDLAIDNIGRNLGPGEATAINNLGTVVGSGGGSQRRATIFDSSGSGANLDLGTLFPSDQQSFAQAVNDSGQIVGISGSGASGYTATLFDSTGAGNNVAIGTIGKSSVSAINNAGIAVGEDHNAAALFDLNLGSIINLNTLIPASTGWELYRAWDINEHGWIVGDGNKGAYLLAPEGTFPNYIPPDPTDPGNPDVPEPACFCLIATAAVAIALKRIRITCS